MTISEFSRDAVCRYLRSVVLIDDAIFNTLTITYDDETLRLDGVPPRVMNGGNASSDVAPDLEVSGGNAHGDETLQLNDDKLLDARAVTDGFARIGVICGVYQPTFYPADDFQNENFQTLLNDCKHADVFILDWNLFKDNASAVSQLLCYLENKDTEGKVPQPVRFCVIYTKANVPTVYTQVYKTLNGQDPEEHPTNELYAIRKNNLTVVIYGQEVASCQIDESQVVSPGGLANRIVQDYTKTYEGILPALALRGIASIRENTKRILDRFPAGMDPALVLHSGLTIGGQSIAEDVTNLIGDEVSSVLSDLQVSSNEIYDLCAEYVNGCADSDFRQTDDTEINKVIASGADEGTIRDFIRRVFKQRTLFPKDSDGAYKAVFSKCKETPNPKFNPNLLKLLRNYVERKIKSPVKFGALSAMFCQRTSYSAKRMLKFGTVVRDAVERNAYYLCLMPSCDSIRLLDYEVVKHSDETEETCQKIHYFPFWKLDAVKDGGMSKAHGLVVKGDDGAYCPLCARGKIRENFRLLKFYSCHGIVEFSDNNCVSTTDNVRTFEWVAELKSAHIQRMAEFVSREFSRVGLTESEWLRLQVNR